ncbi:MAG: lipopolysaccharide kinase InaA family protein [Flavobacteriales bacterium]
MSVKKVFSDLISPEDKKQLFQLIENFDSITSMIGNGKRNIIKTTNFNDQTINIKSFKKPNLINKIVYRFFRKSKAERSFKFAHKLKSLGINTPQPLAYFEFSNLFFLNKSFYVSYNLKYDLSYRELINQPNYPNRETILRKFTQFTFLLHENRINFLDHSPGNTLIVKKGSDFDFYLIDLNRMKFQAMNFEDRMNNFAKLSPKEDMLKIMADEYAKLYKEKSLHEILKTMQYYSEIFSSSYNKREQFKKKYFFWRSY